MPKPQGYDELVYNSQQLELQLSINKNKLIEMNKNWIASELTPENLAIALQLNLIRGFIQMNFDEKDQYIMDEAIVKGEVSDINAYVSNTLRTLREQRERLDAMEKTLHDLNERYKTNGRET